MSAESGDKEEPTDDAVLGGRLRLLQFRRGHRIGHDAILLAAAVDAKADQHAVDLGAGIGAAGLALAARIPGLAVTLVEIEPELVRLAGENIARNALADRARAVRLDVEGPARTYVAESLGASTADHVLMNPPFNAPARQQSSPDTRRRTAHAASHTTLRNWTKAARRLLRAQGTLTLIWRADELPAVLENLNAGFGKIEILPIYGAPGRAAIRIIVRAVKDSRAPLALHSGLMLTDEAGRPSPAAEAVLRHCGALAFPAISPTSAARGGPEHKNKP